MNYEQTQEAIKVMQHYAAGGEIEHRDRPTSCSRKWRPLIDPYWDWSTTEYRIKPKPLELWTVLDSKGRQRGGFDFKSRDEAQSFVERSIINRSANLPFTIVRMREVTE